MKTIPATNPVLGWWFGGNVLPNGDDRPVAVGTVHEVAPPIKACSVGLHCSVRALDALEYASDCSLWRVEVWGECDDSEADKLACQFRRYLWHGDVTHILRRSACRCALDVLPANAPDVVRKYLKLADRATDDQRAAAWYAARDAARYAAWYAARAAAWSAAWSAARAAAWYAAWDAARDAAWDAARAAARDAAWDAARAAAWNRQSVRLEAMLRAEMRRTAL